MRIEEIMTASDLLAGPRGRRLCLQFAAGGGNNPIDAARDLRLAISHVAYELDPGRGSSRVMMFASSFEPDDSTAPTLPQPDPTPRDVAELLATIPLPRPTDRAVMLALHDAVALARYWQEPDGEDVLTALLEVRGALRRVADVIVASPAASRWMSHLDRYEQWSVTFDGDGGDPLQGLNAHERLQRWRADTIADELSAARDRPTDATARYSGSWWSAPLTVKSRTTRAVSGLGPLGLWLVEDSFGSESASAERVEIPHDARVYEIDSAEAWAELCRRFPLSVTASRRHDWYRTTGRVGEWVIPDWSLVAREFDGVHLSVTAYLAAAGIPIPVDAERASVIAGWNPDTTLWLRDTAHNAASATRWQYDRDAETWNEQ